MTISQIPAVVFCCLGEERGIHREKDMISRTVTMPNRIRLLVCQPKNQETRLERKAGLFQNASIKGRQWPPCHKDCLTSFNTTKRFYTQVRRGRTKEGEVGQATPGKRCFPETGLFQGQEGIYRCKNFFQVSVLEVSLRKRGHGAWYG